ncbi:MAG: nuoM [Verrucomicrobiales bacterium]|nr:nuoM [Verrucomicrobiales bacterium]
MSLLTYILGLPFLGALLVLMIPGNFKFIIRSVAQLVTAIPVLLAVWMFYNFNSAPGVEFKYDQMVSWIPSLGISYHVGVDGINLGLVLMATVVAFAAVCVSNEIKVREKEYYFLLLIMIGGIFGAFCCLDVFFLYFFHELALIPTFIMIGVWGRGMNRNYATFQITIYLTIGALIALFGLIAVYLQIPVGSRTFDLMGMTNYFRAHPIALNSQHFIFPLLLFGFGILVSLWPFHTWAPLGYGSAPTATAMLHAGVLKKFGLYMLLRIALPFLPDAAQSWLDIIAVLCLGNIVYCGFVAMRQKDLNLLIGNSSVAHMGFVFLGFASLSLIGVTGALIVMVAHGFLAALTFALSGYIYKQTDTLDMKEMGGLLRKLPFIGCAMIMAMMAGCGLPGFANFAGESLVLFGAYSNFPVMTAIAIWGALVIGAIYMLRGVRNVLHGPLSEKWNGVVDASSAWRRVPYILLIGFLLVFGFCPSLLTEKIKPSAQAVLNMAQRPVQPLLKKAPKHLPIRVK